MDGRSPRARAKPSPPAHTSPREILCVSGKASSRTLSHGCSIRGLKFYYFVCLCNFVRNKQTKTKLIACPFHLKRGLSLLCSVGIEVTSGVRSGG